VAIAQAMPMASPIKAASSPRIFPRGSRVGIVPLRRPPFGDRMSAPHRGGRRPPRAKDRTIPKHQAWRGPSAGNVGPSPFMLAGLRGRRLPSRRGAGVSRRNGQRGDLGERGAGAILYSMNVRRVNAAR
jgi:hypothetical protein